MFSISLSDDWRGQTLRYSKASKVRGHKPGRQNRRQTDGSVGCGHDLHHHLDLDPDPLEPSRKSPVETLHSEAGNRSQSVAPTWLPQNHMTEKPQEARRSPPEKTISGLFEMDGLHLLAPKTGKSVFFPLRAGRANIDSSFLDTFLCCSDMPRKTLTD